MKPLDLNTFAQKIDYVRRASMGVPKTFQIDLSVALTDQKFDISGNLFYVWQSPDQTSYVEIKVNNTREPAIQYIAQTGLNMTVGVAAVELLAANANRKACWIDSDPDNTGNIYLGFDNTVTTRAGGNNWFKCLTPGMGWGVDDYRGAIYAIATAANQYAGVGEW